MCGTTGAAEAAPFIDGRKARFGFSTRFAGLLLFRFAFRLPEQPFAIGPSRANWIRGIRPRLLASPYDSGLLTCAS